MHTIVKKTHQQFSFKTHLIFFLLLFFCSILLANLRFTDESFWLGFQLENMLKQFQSPKLSFVSLAHWFLRHRMPFWIILCLTGWFYRSRIFYLLTTGWFGFSFGFFITTLIRHFRLMSFPLLFGLFLPQLPLYAAAYMLLVKNRIHREPAYLMKCLLLSLLYVGGVCCEYYCNPWILQKIYHLITLIA